MAATLDTARYIDRKTHECGCVTVWDTTEHMPLYVFACGVHRRYAHHWPVTPAIKE